MAALISIRAVGLGGFAASVGAAFGT